MMVSKGCCLLLLFFAVSLRAAPALLFVDLPKNCFAGKVYPCSLRSTNGMLKFERGSESYQLGAQSAVRFLKEDQVQLLTGSLWIEKSTSLQFIVNPEIKLTLDGDFFLEKQKESVVLVRNLNGVAGFQSRFLFKEESLPMGFENWYGTLTTQKQISRGVIRPIEALPFLKSWSPISGLSPAEVKKRVQFYRKNWSENIEVSTQFYQEVIERRLASQESLDQARVNRLKAASAEKSRIRQMYRQKAGFDHQD